MLIAKKQFEILIFHFKVLIFFLSKQLHFLHSCKPLTHIVIFVLILIRNQIFIIISGYFSYLKAHLTLHLNTS